MRPPRPLPSANECRLVKPPVQSTIEEPPERCQTRGDALFLQKDLKALLTAEITVLLSLYCSSQCPSPTPPQQLDGGSSG